MPDLADLAPMIENAPFCAMLGIKVEAAANGEARLRMPWRADLLNNGGPQAPIHGGAIASLIDSAALAALITMPLSQSATISMTVNYVNIAASTALIATAKVRRRGRTIASLSVEVQDESGRLIADSLVTFRVG